MVTIMKATPVVRSASSADHQRRAAAPASDAGDESAAGTPQPRCTHGEAGAVEPGGEEHGVAEAEQAGIAEQEVVADGEDRQHHDAGEVAVVIGAAARTAAQEQQR